METRLMIYTLVRRQEIETTPERAWDFIKDPGNLNDITPPDLHFEILSEVPAEMWEGLLIRYRIRVPILGRVVWLTEIKHIREDRSFVDEQRIGPYRMWCHFHEILPTKTGVTLVDRVTYALPYGLMGRWVHRFFVRRALERIFDYRAEKLSALLSVGGSVTDQTMDQIGNG